MCHSKRAVNRFNKFRNFLSEEYQYEPNKVPKSSGITSCAMVNSTVTNGDIQAQNPAMFIATSNDRPLGANVVELDVTRSTAAPNSVLDNTNSIVTEEPVQVHTVRHISSLQCTCHQHG